MDREVRGKRSIRRQQISRRLKADNDSVEYCPEEIVAEAAYERGRTNTAIPNYRFEMREGKLSDQLEMRTDRLIMGKENRKKEG